MECNAVLLSRKWFSVMQQRVPGLFGLLDKNASYFVKMELSRTCWIVGE